MVIALTGFSFDGNTENGGVVVKLGIYRVQGAWIAKKNVRKSWRDGEGCIKYDGKIMCEKGDTYMVDCTVTVADAGTLDAQNLFLKYLFKEYILP